MANGSPDARGPAGRDRPPELFDGRLAEAGFDLVGILGGEAWDALVPEPWSREALLPGARSAVVLGCGGPRFGDLALAAAEGEAGDAQDVGRLGPFDGFTERVVRGARARLARRAPTRALFYWERRGERFADFVALGRAAGLGVPGRLGLLLHPEYGPWLSLRAVLLTELALEPTPPLSGFDPCAACPAPCASACPGDAVRAEGFAVAACTAASGPDTPCARRCAARHACVFGPQHAFSAGVEARFRAAALRAARSAG